MPSRMKNHYALYMGTFNLAIFIHFVTFYECINIDLHFFQHQPAISCSHIIGRRCFKVLIYRSYKLINSMVGGGGALSNIASGW